jgi:hypothetical protein
MNADSTMSASDGNDSVISGTNSQHAAQADPFLHLTRASGSLHSDGESEANFNGSVSSNPTSPAPGQDAADIDMDAGSEASDHKDEPEDDSGLEDEPIPERLNKYHGPPSTWRSWTEQERLLAASLDQIRAADLSIHLYNAHAMKRRLRTKEQQNKVPSWGRKERWVGTRDNSEESTVDEDGDPFFVPPKVWTAWPLPPDEGPREGEKMLGRKEYEDEAWTLRKEGSGMPSEELQELLVAEFLKRAKERFRQREWESSDEEVGVTSGSEDVSMKKARKTSASASGSHDDALKSEKGIYLKPVIMADDDRAREILRPTVRHILSKLDGLLVGLHHARQAHLPTGDETTASETQTDMEETAPAPKKRQAKRRRKRKRISKTNGKTGLDAEPAIDLDTDSDSNFSPSIQLSPSPPRPRPEKRQRSTLSPRSASLSRQKRQKRLGLRDWSDVLGVASLVGFDAAVVERATERCTKLFGEGIRFRTLHEGKEADSETEHISGKRRKLPGPPQEIVPRAVDEPSTHEQSKNPMLLAADGRYYCPWKYCKRSQLGFARSWNANKHLKEIHDDKRPYKYKDNTEVEEELVGGIHVDGFMKPIQARPGWRGKDYEESVAN